MLFSKGVSTASSSSCCDLADFYARSVLSVDSFGSDGCTEYGAGEERGTAVSSYSLSWFGAAFQPIMLICLVSYEADLPCSSICKVLNMLNNHYVHIFKKKWNDFIFS